MARATLVTQGSPYSAATVMKASMVSLSTHSALTICRPIKLRQSSGAGQPSPTQGPGHGAAKMATKKSLRDQIRELVSLCPDSEGAARPTTEEKIASVDRAIPEESIA